MDKAEKREVLKSLVNIKAKFTAKGYKSSEGDGRTAADIERELEKNGPKRSST